MFDFDDRKYVLSFVAIGVVIAFVGYLMLNQQTVQNYIDDSGKPAPVNQICVGENCEDEKPRDNPFNITTQPNRTVNTTSTGSPSSGGGGSYSPPPIELIEPDTLGEECSSALVAYCDAWEHAFYVPENLPFGNLTFIEWQPQCYTHQFFREFGQPSQQDCQNLYLNLTSP